MEYRCGTIGRCFFVRFDHNDDMLEELKQLAVTENIRQAWLCCLGALKHAHIVTGPQQSSIPPIPLTHTIPDGHEVIGTGNILWMDGKPAVHLHGAFGRADKTRVGCMRKDVEVYLTIECCIFEFDAEPVLRRYDPELEINTMHFDNSHTGN